MSQIQLHELLIASHNPGKVTEIKEALGGLTLRLRYVDEFCGVKEPDETGASYTENAVIKAQSYAAQIGICSLADDSGLEVATLGGAPGLKSARFGGPKISETQRCKLLLSKLSGAPDENRRARFVCVMVLADPSLGVMNIAEGKCEGKIAQSEAGSSGFGFDPLFVPEGFELTFAQLPLASKIRISHRAKALAKTRKFLEQLLSSNLTTGLAGP
jgi:XTP/dITP diphosphohydrolase